MSIVGPESGVSVGGGEDWEVDVMELVVRWGDDGEAGWNDPITSIGYQT